MKGLVGVRIRVGEQCKALRKKVRLVADAKETRSAVWVQHSGTFWASQAHTLPQPKTGGSK